MSSLPFSGAANSQLSGETPEALRKRLCNAIDQLMGESLASLNDDTPKDERNNFPQKLIAIGKDVPLGEYLMALNIMQIRPEISLHQEDDLSRAMHTHVITSANPQSFEDNIAAANYFEGFSKFPNEEPISQALAQRYREAAIKALEAIPEGRAKFDMIQKAQESYKHPQPPFGDQVYLCDWAKMTVTSALYKAADALDRSKNHNPSAGNGHSPIPKP